MTTKKIGLLALLSATLGCLPSLALAAPTNHIQIKVSGLKSGDALILLNEHSNDRLTIPDSSNPQAQLNGTFSMPTAMALNDVISVTANDSYTPGLACSITGNQGVTVEQTGMQPVQVACGHPQAAQKAGGQPRGSVSGAVGQADLNSSGGGSALPDLDNSSAGESGSGDNLILPGQASAPALAENNPAKPALDNAGGSENGDNLTLPEQPLAQAGGNSSLSSKPPLANQPAGQNANQGVQPMDGTHKTTRWNCYTIDDPDSTNGNTEITGINQIQDIVGTIDSPTQSFFAKKTSKSPPSYSKFTPIEIKGAMTVAAAGLDTRQRLEVGVYADTDSVSHGWVRDRRTGILKDYGPMLLESVAGVLVSTHGFNHGGITAGDSIAAGQESIGQSTQSYYLDLTTGWQAALPLPSGSVVTAIGQGRSTDLESNFTNPATFQVGFAGNSSDGIWYYNHSNNSKKSQYFDLGQFAAKGVAASSTTASGINFEKDIAGNFYDQNGVMHGFILYHPPQEQNWVQFDCAPSGVTVEATHLSTLNSKLALAGYYVDSNGIHHGFVATPAN